MIVQITMTRNELFLIKEMLEVWKDYADGFVFLDDRSTDGTYEFLIENKEKYNILSILKTNIDNDKLVIETDLRQRLYDEALKYSNNIIYGIIGDFPQDELDFETILNPSTSEYVLTFNPTVSATYRFRYLEKSVLNPNTYLPNKYF